MVSPSQLMAWRPTRLAEAAEDVLRHRRVLTGLHDDLDTGAPPASWTFADADQARDAHRDLAEQLATQVSETVGVIEALDSAATTITSAQHLLDGAMHRAGASGFHVDRSTGRVRIVRTFDDAAEHAYARVVRNEVAEQIETALRDAELADQALAAALSRAAATDVNDVGSLDQQQALLDLQQQTPAEQAAYLLAHPEEYARFGDHVSDAVKARIGESIADDLDRMARHPADLDDADAVARYHRLLGAVGDDPDVMGPLYDRLGADGLLGAYAAVSERLIDGSQRAALTDLADALRHGLQTATLDEDFDGEAFGTSLVRYATGTAGGDATGAYDRAYGDSVRGSEAAALDYLLRDGGYDEDFVRGVVWELDRFETTDPQRAELWRETSELWSPLPGLEESQPGRLPDPMAAALGRLGDHPALGLEFFTEDEGRYAQYFTERDWSRDGFEGISRAALGIGTDPGNLAGAGRDTGMFVSEFFDRITKNPEFTAEHAGAASEPIGDLLKHYMPAVESAVSGAGGPDESARLRDLTDAYLPRLTDYPMLDSVDLDKLLAVGLSSEEGMARIAEGSAGYRQSVLSAFAAEHLGSAGTAEEQTILQNLLNSSTGIDGYVQNRISEIAIDGAKSRDQQVAVYTDLVSEAAGLVPVPGSDMLGDVIGDLGTKVVDHAWGKVQEIPGDRVTQSFGTNEDAMRDTQTGEAMNGRQRSIITSYLALARAGLVEVPTGDLSTWAPGGHLISLGDIPAGDLQRYYSEATAAMIGVVNEESLRGAYKDPFTEWN